MREKTPPRDVYQDITDAIVAAIEQGVEEVRLPWLRTGMSNILPRNCHTDRAYNGINVLALFCSAAKRGYAASIWGTYRQWQEIGAQVRKDEKGTLIVFYKSYDAEPDPEDDSDDGRRRVAKQSFVFNCAQVDGFQLPDIPDRPMVEKRAEADRFFKATGVRLVTGGDSAYYAPSTDHVQMPDERLFTGADEIERSENYYSILSHEHGHATGAKHRLARDLSGRFGSEAYAVEELVAELTSAFLMARLGMAAQPRKDHACYIANWLKVLKNDKKAIFAAAARAQEAVDYMVGLQTKELVDAA